MKQYIHLSDDELVALVKRRDGEALLQLYEKYRLPIFSLVMRILKDREIGEEVLQDVFQRLWDKPEKFESCKGQLLGWLLTVGRNISIDYKRKASRRAVYHVYPDEMAQLEQMSVTDESLNAESIQSVRNVLESLPAEQRRVLELSYFEGLTHVELAQILGESVGTIKTRIRLGMQKLKQAFDVPLLQ